MTKPMGCLVLLRRSGDQPRAALEGDVRPQPFQQHDNPIPKADEEGDVDEAPQQPGETAIEADPAEISDGAAAADGREAAEIAINERCDRAAGQTCAHNVGNVRALL